MRINPLPAGTAGRDNSPFSKEKRVKRRIAKMASESNGIKELEVCHEALKKGLISQADYDTAKQTFLRVQQLSPGVWLNRNKRDEGNRKRLSQGSLPCRSMCEVLCFWNRFLLP